MTWKQNKKVENFKNMLSESGFNNWFIPEKLLSEHKTIRYSASVTKCRWYSD